MDYEPLSLFPSETELPAKAEHLSAAAPSPSEGTDARVRAAVDRIHALEHDVEFLKARSHVGHALADDPRNTRVLHADAASTSHERQAITVDVPSRRMDVAVIIVLAMVLGVAGARFLPADHSPIKQTELLPALTAPALKIAEPAIAPHIPPLAVSARHAQASSRNALARTVFFKGHLVVDSVPPGATVRINQRLAGTTPLRVRDYRAGSYAVWVERDGYERWTAGVLVAADKTTHIRAMLRSKSDRQRANAK